MANRNGMPPASLPGMQFRVESRLHYQVYGPASLLCSIRGLRSAHQELLDEAFETTPAAGHWKYAIEDGKQLLDRFDPSENGSFTIDYRGRFETSIETVKVEPRPKPVSYPDDPDVLPYLFPSRYAPSDRFRTHAHELFGEIEDPFHQALAVENWLFEKLTYVYGISNEQTWAPDTFERRQGVCRDYAHLGIAFCRALFLPARYVTAYCYGLQPQDFHAAFDVYIDGRWHLMDPTRLVPLNSLVRIATGRDAADTAVATLVGDITSTGMEVYVYEDEESGESFQPLTRAELDEEGRSIVVV